MDPRLQGLREWLASLGPDVELGAADPLVPASRDASFRRYYRVPYRGGTAIAMDAPAPSEDLGRFLRLARAFAAHRVRVPAIHAADPHAGYALIEDFGTRTLLPELDEHSVDALYDHAMDGLIVIQELEPEPDWCLPVYDFDFFMREMEIFREWLLGVHLALPGEATDVLDHAFELLAREALAQPMVVVHRDYHSRNLMILEESDLGVIDFQDAVTGPLTYDLVSLLRDCYVQWPGARVDAWALAYFQRLRAAGNLDDAWDDERLLRAFDLMGVQRHLKAAGIFARLWHRDGRDDYLADIPRTLGYVAWVCHRQPELNTLGAWLVDTVGPRTGLEMPPEHGVRR